MALYLIEFVIKWSQKLTYIFSYVFWLKNFLFIIQTNHSSLSISFSHPYLPTPSPIHSSEGYLHLEFTNIVW